MTPQIKPSIWNRKKGQFLPRDWVMSLILFGGVVLLATLMVSSLAVEYDNTGIIDEDIAEDFGDLTASTNIAKAAFDATNKQGALTITGSFSILFQSAFTIISLIFGSLGIVSSQFTALGTFLGMPSEVSSVIFVILLSLAMVVLVFGIISTTQRREI